MNAIEIARKMETDAIKFYSEAANKTGYLAGKKMFETIVEDEKRHLEIVNKLLQGLDIHVEDVYPMKNIKTVFEIYKRKMMEKVKASTDELEALRLPCRWRRKGLSSIINLCQKRKQKKRRRFFRNLLGKKNSISPSLKIHIIF